MRLCLLLLLLFLLFCYYTHLQQHTTRACVQARVQVKFSIRHGVYKQQQTQNNNNAQLATFGWLYIMLQQQQQQQVNAYICWYSFPLSWPMMFSEINNNNNNNTNSNKII